MKLESISLRRKVFPLICERDSASSTPSGSSSPLASSEERSGDSPGVSSGVSTSSWFSGFCPAVSSLTVDSSAEASSGCITSSSWGAILSLLAVSSGGSFPAFLAGVSFAAGFFFTGLLASGFFFSFAIYNEFRVLSSKF